MVLLVAPAGTGQPVQAGMNAALRKGLQSPTLASLLQFLLAAVVLGCAVGAGLMGRGTFAQAANIPWWAWFGGAVGAVSVTVNLLAVSKVGAAPMIAAALVGPLIAAGIVDHFGWVGVSRVPLNPWRIAGMVLLLGGLFLVQKKYAR